MSIDYTTAGVNVDVGNAVARSYAPLAKTTHDRNVLPHQNGFAAAYQLSTDSQTILLAATDGVGTKLLLANQLQQHTTIGIDLVAMVANDLLADGAQPLFSWIIWQQITWFPRWRRTSCKVLSRAVSRRA